MCGSTKAPQVVKQDPVADQKKADAKATQATNAETALRRRQAAQNSLLTIGAAGTDPLKKTPYTLLGSLQRGVRTTAPGHNPKLGFGGLKGGDQLVGNLLDKARGNAQS